MHDKIPRPDAAKSMKLVTNVFGPDLLHKDIEYYEGILSVSGAYFAVGIAAFFIFFFVYSFACACRSKTRRAAKGGCCSTFCGVLFGPRLWFLIAAIVMLGGTSAALSQVTAFRSSVDKAVSALDDFDSILNTANNLVNSSLTPALDSTLAAITAFSASAPVGGWPAPVQSAITSMQAQVTDGSTNTAAVASRLASLTSAIDGTVHSSSSNPLDVHTLGTRVFQGGVTALAIFLGFVLFSVFGLPGTKCGASFFRWFDACGLVLSVLLVCIFAGLFMAIALVGSDVCVDPSTAVLAIANQTNSGTLAMDTLTYYTGCGANPGLPPLGAYSDVTLGESSLVNGLSTYASMLSAVNSTAEAHPAIEWIGGNLTAANVSIAALADTLRCAPLADVYDRVLDAICSTGIVAVIKTWALATAAVILIFAMVSAGARLCWSHPGDPLDPQDEQAAMAAAGVKYAPQIAGPTSVAPATGPPAGGAYAYA